jgi:hypothetical protein
MGQPRSVYTAAIATAIAFLVGGGAARADIPAGYTGKPFDPAVNGGPKCPAKAKAGPYPIPGRLDFVNYDVGGDGTTFHAGDKLIKPGDGYRTDRPTASLSLTTSCISLTNMPCMNVWYDNGNALDGTVYPSATDADFSIAAVQNGDWFNLTVDVKTSGTYNVSSTWASGNGPPGGEGGDGTMGLSVFSNGVKLGTWSAIFPNFNMFADFHHWKTYPSMMTVNLTAGLQVIKLQSNSKHLQLDFVQFDLVGADGGVPEGDASTTGAAGAGAAGAGGSGAAGTGAVTGTAGAAGGAAGAGGSTGGATAGAAGGSSGPGSAGVSGTAGAGTVSGAAGSTSGGAAGSAPAAAHASSSGCAIAGSGASDWSAGASLLTLGCALLSLRRRRR